MRTIIALILFSVSINAQTIKQSYASWKSDFDTYMNDYSRTEGTYRYFNGGGLEYASGVLSSSEGDMYFDGYRWVGGLTKMWQATGDNSYLDLALDMAEGDINGAPVLQDFYTTGAGVNAQAYQKKLWGTYRGNVVLPNHWIEAPYNYEFVNGNAYEMINGVSTQIPKWSFFGPPLDDYILETNGSTGFNYVAARDPNGVYEHQALGENIYYRYVADMLRIMNHNPNILTQISGNGQTYQQRFDFVLDYIETHVYEKWVEFESEARHWEFHVARVNLHMTTHLPSVAVSLYSITQEQKYLDFVEELLWDIGSNPLAPNQDAGVGILDRFQYVLRGSEYFLYESATWNTLPQNGGHQDAPHAGAEFHFILQCFEEGIGLNPPAGEHTINLQFIQDMAHGFQLYFPEDGNETNYAVDRNLHQYNDRTGSISSGYSSPEQGQFYFGAYDTRMLEYAEFNTPDVTIGHILYNQRVHGINGLTAPVYPNTGTNGGLAPPNVTLVGDEIMTLTVGDTYTELGATYFDNEDGSGTIAIPTAGSVNTSVAGQYFLNYTYIDTDSFSDTATRTVNVVAVGNDCPVINLIGDSSVLVNLNSTYTEQGATYTDLQDGSGNATVGGDTVDTSTVGTYIVDYSHTDTNNCTITISRTVTVIDPGSNILITAININEAKHDFVIGDPIDVPYTISPSNATNQVLNISVNNSDVLLPSGDGYVADKAGTGVITLSTTDGSNISKTINYVVFYEEGSVMYRLLTRQQGNVD